jgi:DNA-binding Lrp family transcriptional regulator
VPCDAQQPIPASFDPELDATRNWTPPSARVDYLAARLQAVAPLASNANTEMVAAALRDVSGVSEVATVTGSYDVIARAEARDIDELGRQVVSRVQALGGAARTLTCPVIHL